MKVMRVFLQLFKMRLAVELRYRMSLLLYILTSALWNLVPVAFFWLVFTQTPTIAGWTLEQVILLNSIAILVWSLFNLLFAGGLALAGEYIRTGELDHIVTKPIDPMIHLSVRYTSLAWIGDTLLGVSLFAFAFSQLSGSLAPYWGLYLSVPMVCAIVVLYSLHVMVASVSFWTIKGDQMTDLLDIMGELTPYPTNVYPPALQLFFIFVVPIGLIATVPASVVVGSLPPSWLLYSAITSALFLLVSRAVWNLGMRRYASAGS